MNKNSQSREQYKIIMNENTGIKADEEIKVKEKVDFNFINKIPANYFYSSNRNTMTSTRHSQDMYASNTHKDDQSYNTLAVKEYDRK